jgi:hypothetical protein
MSQFTTFLKNVDDVIINPLILLAFALATLYFFYGIVKFLNPNTGEKDKIEARSAILWGIVGMAIMFSVYGIIGFVLSTFGINKAPVTSSNVLSPCQYVTQPNGTQNPCSSTN